MPHSILFEQFTTAALTLHGNPFEQTFNALDRFVDASGFENGRYWMLSIRISSETDLFEGGSISFVDLHGREVRVFECLIRVQRIL
jgi:hypothetical protein